MHNCDPAPQYLISPAHEIMALFVLRKLILRKCMHSHPMGLDVWFLVRPVVYFHTLYVQTAKALARLRRCAGSPENSLVAYVISTISHELAQILAFNSACLFDLWFNGHIRWCGVNLTSLLLGRLPKWL